jgi:hypothetical protein
MATTVTMSATIMTQRSDFADQRSFRVTASRVARCSDHAFARPRRFRSRPILDSIPWIMKFQTEQVDELDIRMCRSAVTDRRGVRKFPREITNVT